MIYADTEPEEGRRRRAGRCWTPGPRHCLESDLIGELVADAKQKTPAGRPLYREHFGFADGISQPEIEGTYRAVNRVAERGSQHLVKPGEFLLGYTAGDGTVNPGIAIDARLDRHALLPAVSSGDRAGPS